MDVKGEAIPQIVDNCLGRRNVSSWRMQHQVKAFRAIKTINRIHQAFDVIVRYRRLRGIGPILQPARVVADNIAVVYLGKAPDAVLSNLVNGIKLTVNS